MTTRIQVLLEETEREAFRAMAQKEGLSLSAWLRKAGKEKVLESARNKKIHDLKSLKRFFRHCDELGDGIEPDWEDHLKVINQSRRQGQAES